MLWQGSCNCNGVALNLKFRFMKDTTKKQKKQKKQEDTNADYNPTARDFQRTEEDIDAVSKSEKDFEDENKRTEKGNTKPNKKKIN
jgi:hypothetical protein